MKILALSTRLPSYTDVSFEGLAAPLGSMVMESNLQRKVRLKLRVGRLATSSAHECIHLFDTHSQTSGKRVNSQAAQQILDVITIRLPNSALSGICGGYADQSM